MKKIYTLATVLGLYCFPIYSQEIVDTEHPSNGGIKVGGHYGIVHGIITFSKDKTTNISDHYSIGFPVGITLKKSDKCAFDVEFVPFIDEHNNVNLLFHPGGLYALGSNFTIGTRAAFEINSGAYGFTPLLNKAFPCKNGGAFFVELVLPVRFYYTGSSLTAGIHVGVGF